MAKDNLEKAAEAMTYIAGGAVGAGVVVLGAGMGISVAPVVAGVVVGVAVYRVKTVYRS